MFINKIQNINLMKIKASELVLILFFMALLGCEAPDDSVQVKIITTADVHAVIFPHDFINDTPMDGSLARVFTYVEKQRENKNQHVLLLDNADLLQGQPTGYYFNFIADREINLFADVMNHIGFDAASVGNHDVEMGPEVYNHLKKEFDFPWLAANIIDKKTGSPYFEPYVIFERDGVRIAVLGLVTPSVPTWLPRKLWEGLEFRGMYESATEWMQYILDHEQPHAVIGLFHSGEGPDMEYAGVAEPPENASLYVGRHVPGFDVIFTAHDHRVRNKTFTNVNDEEVLMIAGQSFGRSVAVADLVFRKNEMGSFYLASKTGSVEEMAGYEPHAGFLATFDKEYQQVKEFVAQPLGTLQKTLYSREAYRGNSAFVDFIHNIQLQLTGAEISLAAPLSFNAVLEQGEVTVRDMFRLYPFENYLYVMTLSGQEIRDLLEYSYGLWYNTMAGPDDHLMLFRQDEQGALQKDNNGRARFANAFYNFDSAAGINYVVDVSKPVGQRVTIASLASGARFDPGRNYKVAINSYRGSGGGGHVTHGAGIPHADLDSRIVWVSERDLRGHIADYIREAGLLSPEAGNNWKVIPADWAERAAERDHKLLFGE